MQTEEPDSWSGGDRKLPENPNHRNSFVRIYPNERSPRIEVRLPLRTRLFLSLLVVTALTAGLLVALPTPPASADFCIMNGTRMICFFPQYPEPPPQPCTQASCLDPGTLTVPIKGYVRDPRGEPIAGATVYWQYGYDTTNSSGYFQMEVWADKPVTLYAKHSLHQWREKHIAAPAAASPFLQNFEGAESLPFLLATLVSPKYFNTVPTSTVVEAYTSAPPAAGLAIAEFDSGAVLQLTLDTEAQLTSGWYRWYRQIDVPSVAVDGTYGYRACFVATGVALDCDGPVSAVISQVKAESYVLDRVAPSVVSTFPARSRNVVSLTSISATWQDPLSGTDPASLKIWIDGVVASVSVSGGTVSTSGSGISAGIHRVDVEARDLAGNIATDSFEFALVTLDADPATATLREQTIQVNPSGDLVGPSTVTFASPKVSVEGFEERINASTFVGYGNVHRPFALGVAQVVFENETGVPATVNVSIPASKATHGLATLARSENPLVASIPPSEVTLSNLVVDVPVGYNTSGSTARLVAASASLGSAFTDSIYLLQNEITNGVDPISVTVQTNLHVEQNPDASFGVSSTTTVFARYQPAGLDEPLELFVRGNPVGNYEVEPKIICGPTESEPNPKEYFTPSVPCFATGASLLRNHSRVMVISPTLAFHANHWLYRDKQEDIYLAWHQVSTLANDGDCVNGRAIRPRIKEVKTSTSQVLLDPVTQKSSWGIAADGAVYSSTGAPDTEDSIYLVGEPLLPWGSQNSLSKKARFSASAVPAVIPITDGEGSPPIGPISTGLVQASPAGLSNTTEQMVLGARYESRGSDPSLSQVIQVVATESWLVDADVVSCP